MPIPGRRSPWRQGASAQRVLLVDTTQHLTRMRLARSGPRAVVTQTGAAMEDVLEFLQAGGLGWVAHPAPGDLTIGGVLAIDGHGTAIPAHGERRVRGETFGSVSNLILSLKAVVWSERRRRFVLRTFERDDPACASLLTHLGRALVTRVTLRAGPLRHLRCVSLTDVPGDELFAPPGSSGRTFASFLEGSGRVEAILYPFTDAPWLKVWTVSAERPAGSREVTKPYNYPFSDTLTDAEQEEVRQRILSDPSEAVPLGQESYADTVAGLASERSGDIWGAAKDVFLYVRPATLRVTANGYAILTRRRDVQRVISEFVARYREVVAAYRAQGLYPLNMPLEIRVTGLDHPRDVGVDGAQRALLSALAPRADHPGWDVAVWLDILSFPGTPAADQAYRDIERFLFANYRPPYATVRPEWSKGWAYTERGAWTNQRMIRRTIPRSFGAPAASMKRGTPPCAPLTGSTRTASSRAPSCVHCCASARTELPNRLQRLTASGTWVRPTPSEFPREGSWTSSGRTSERPLRPATARWWPPRRPGIGSSSRSRGTTARAPRASAGSRA